MYLFSIHYTGRIHTKSALFYLYSGTRLIRLWLIQQHGWSDIFSLVPWYVAFTVFHCGIIIQRFFNQNKLILRNSKFKHLHNKIFKMTIFPFLHIFTSCTEWLFLKNTFINKMFVSETICSEIQIISSCFCEERRYLFKNMSCTYLYIVIVLTYLLYQS